VFSPVSIGSFNGVLSIGSSTNTTLIFSLTATAKGPVFTYTALTGTGAMPFSPNTALSWPDTEVGQTTGITVQVTNTGNANGTITTILVNGQGYQLANVPIFPILLSPNSSTQFKVNFTPSQPGVSKGYLQIGSDVFNLTANGKGPLLLYSYISSVGAVAIQAGQTVLWGNAQIGETSKFTFVIGNQGNEAAAISGVAIVNSQAAFRVANLPPLPATIAPGGMLSFSLLFSPAALGDNAGQLRVNSDTFNLVGSGSNSLPLPAISVNGPSEAPDAMQQPALGLTLASPYRIALSGTLTLTVSSASFSVDPAVQFATGGPSVAFTIPVNTTAAQFPTGRKIQIQTGTVAATIKVTATLSIGNGIDVTPDPPPSLTLQVPAGPPHLLDIQIASQTASGFTVVVTGLSTTRSLTQLELDFTPNSGYRIPASQFKFNIGDVASQWYGSSLSQAYGSLFSASIPFSFRGAGSLGLGQVFQSISGTLTNEMGTSSSFSMTPQP
jgi:hypothetical protein